MENVLKIYQRVGLPKPTWGEELTAEEKDKVAMTMNRVQKMFKERLGLHVDEVRQSFGNSNDGNTSRRFFKNPPVTAEITKVDERLIHRFGTILDTINCKQNIDVTKFEEYCSETAQLYVSLYDWYPMVPTKVLVHGSRMISEASLPIGMLGEEAQEAANKVYRNTRLHHARKCDRIASNADVFHMMLARSDPLVSTMNKRLTPRVPAAKPDVQALLSDYDITSRRRGLRPLAVWTL